MSPPKDNNYKPLNKHACDRFEDDHMSGKEVFSSHVSIGKAESNSDDRKYWITIRQEVCGGGTSIADNVRGIRWKVPNGVGDFCQCILLMLILFRLMQM